MHPDLNELKNKVKAVQLSQNKIADMLMEPEANSDLIEIMSSETKNIANKNLERKCL